MIVVHNGNNSVISKDGRHLGEMGIRESTGEWVFVIQPGLRVQTGQDVSVIKDALDQLEGK